MHCSYSLRPTRLTIVAGALSVFNDLIDIWIEKEKIGFSNLILYNSSPLRCLCYRNNIEQQRSPIINS